ncbi:MAG: hypothetical protein LBG64_03430 [Pseudomonadales bacterium]|jgi:hypothetical protein|nr:hypothetical protein [Pseudomonadales bacterium]
MSSKFWNRPLILRQITALAVITLIFILSRGAIYWAFQLTADAQIINNNFFRSNRFTVRHSQVESSLDIPTDSPVHTITMIAHINATDENPTVEASLAATINHNPATIQYFSLTTEHTTITIDSPIPIEHLHFYIDNKAYPPWTLKYITTDQAYFTNLLNHLPFASENGWHHFEDHNDNPARSFSEHLVQWDGEAYIEIAKHGYTYDGNYLSRQNIAWPFLYPFSIRLAQQLIPGERTFSSVAVALNLAYGFVSLVLLYGLARHFIRNFWWRFMPLILFAFSPFAIFLTTTHTESLFITLLLGFLLSLIYKKYWLAAIFMCGMGATRVAGLPLLILFWIPLQFPLIGIKKDKAKSLLINSGLTIISLLGFFSFLYYIRAQFGTPWFDPLRIQQAWGYNVPGEGSLIEFFSNIISGFTPNAIRNFILNPYFAGLYVNLTCLIISLIAVFKSFKFRLKPLNYKITNAPLFYMSSASILLLMANLQTLLYQQNYTLHPAKVTNMLIRAIVIRCLDHHGPSV